MRTSGGKAAPSSRWPEVLFRVLICSIPLCSCCPLGAAFAASDPAAFDPRTLLTLGIILGIIAFAIGTAIACLRATERARKAEAAAEIEAERYRMSESTLETLLTAEPQALMVVAEIGRGRAARGELAGGARRAARRGHAVEFRRLARRGLGRKTLNTRSMPWPSAARPST